MEVHPTVGSKIAGGIGHLKLLEVHVMFNSATLCRQREAHHRLLASEAVLDNARKVALTAAAAWGKEAVEAEAREAGRIDQLSAADAEIALEFLLEDDEEDPDSAVAKP